MPIDYAIKIPIEVSGQQALSQIDTILGRIGSTTKATSGELRLLESILKADAAAGMALSESLKDVSKSTQAFSPIVRQAAADILKAATASEQSTKALFESSAAANTAAASYSRLDGVLARIGGRFAGMASGIPGGGFVGAQYGGSLGLSGGAALGFGAAGAGLFAAFEYTKQIEELTKWSQAQKNLAAETGVTVGQMQQLSRVSEITGVSLTAATKATSNLAEEMLKGGARAKEIGSALGQLGLGTSTAFQNPATAIDQIANALSKIPDMGDRMRIASQLGESFRSLAAIAGEWTNAVGKTKIIDDDTMKRLDDARQQMKELGNEWDVLLAKTSKPLTFVIRAVNEAIEGPSAVSLVGDVAGGAKKEYDKAGGILGFLNGDYIFRRNFVGAGPIEPSQPTAPTAPLQTSITPAEKDARLKQFNHFASAYGTPEDRYSAAVSDISTKQDDLKRRFTTGTVSQAEAQSQYASLEAQKEAAKERERNAVRLREEREHFQQLIRKPVESGAESLRLLGQLPRDFPDLTDTQDYVGFRTWLTTNPSTGVLGYLKAQGARTAAEAESESRQQQRIDLRGYDRQFRTEQRQEPGRIDQGFVESAGLITRGLNGQRSLDLARAQQRLAISTGSTSRYGLTSSQIRGLDYTQSAAAIQAELAPQRTALLRTAYIDQYAASQVTPGSDARLKLDADARAALLELEVKETDAKTKGIEAINKFNESIDKATEAMRSQFAGGFESILMGAQHGALRGQAGKGALDALRGFGESIESTILHNVGAKIFDTGGGSALRKLGGFLPDWATNGSLLGKVDEPIKANTDATSLNTKAIDANTAAQRSGGTGSVLSNGALNYTPANYTPVPASSSSSSSSGLIGAAGDVASIAGAASALSTVTSGSASQDLKAVAGTLGKLDAIMKGTQYTGDFSKIFSGTLGTTQEIGAIAGTVGAGLGAYEGINTIAKGGARNITSGAAATVGSLTPIVAGIAKDLGAVSSVTNAIPVVGAAISAGLGLISSFIPSGQTQRSNAIQKAIFTDQYLAAPSQNISASGNGGYADVDIYGNVRTSNFSPYPLVDQPYLDVPRRTVVPGGTVSAFGGGSFTGGQRPQNPVPGTISPTSAPTYHLHINAIDSKSIMDRAGDITDAVNSHLNAQYHPMLTTVASQLGLR